MIGEARASSSPRIEGAGAESKARRMLGFVFGASLGSATVAAIAALATRLALPEAWSAAAALLGAAIGAAFSSLIGTYALSWRSAGWGAGLGAALGVLPQPAWTGWNPVAGCWAAAAVAALAVPRERVQAAQSATSPALVAAIHALQLPLILFSLAVSFVSAWPRPFVILFTVSAFALWRLLDGECPLSRAERQLRALRGEEAQMGEIGFIAYQIQRTTGLLIPRGSVSGLAYAVAAVAFAWYAVQALR